MHLTIKDVIQLFHEQAVAAVTGSSGLDNTVLSVNIMDAPDIWNWVKPGDLILTTAYTIKDDAALQERLVRELAVSGCAGLGIKTKRFLPEIPPRMKAIATELNFPILELPLNLSLAEIMNPIISSIAARQSFLLQRANEIHRALTKAAIKGGGLPPIIACLGKLIQSPVGCYDTNGSPLNHWIPDNISGISTHTLKQLDQYLAAQAPENDQLQKNLSLAKAPYTQPVVIDGSEFMITSFAIMSDNEFFGHISILQATDAFLDINRMALEHTCTVAALDFLKQKAVLESRRLYSREMLENILFDDLSGQNAAEILAGSSLVQAKYCECSVIMLDKMTSEVNVPIILAHLYKMTQQIVTAKYPLSLVSERKGRIITLLASGHALTGEDSRPYVRLQKAFLAIHHDLKISIGVGTPAVDINTIRQSYHDALTCLHLGRTIKGTGHITYPHEVASYTLFADSNNFSMLSHVSGSIILKLENADRVQGTDFLRTMEQYLECDKSLTDTAKELYIHRNTLANRLEKIADIAAIDFTDRELLFSLRLALRKRKISQL